MNLSKRFKRAENWKSRLCGWADRDWDKFDLIFMAVVFMICYVSFVQGDIMVTGNRSFLMHTNPLNFYDACAEWTNDYGANYLPSTFLMFAIWNLPLRLFGRVPSDVMTNSLLNNMWYKMLPVIFFFASAVLIYKICIQAGFGEKKARICKYAFLICPLALFSQMIFSQYDIFTVFFILLGYYYYLRREHWKFVLFFGIAVTFKYQAVIYFLVFLLLKEKKIFKILRDAVLVALPTVIEILIYYPSASFRKSVLGFSALTYVETGLDLGGLRPINVFLVVILVLLIAAYLIKIENKDKIFDWTLFLANGVSFAFFGMVAFHPQWLLLAVPFMILAIQQNKNCKLLWILQNILIIALYTLVVQNWAGNVDQNLFRYSVFKGVAPSGWAITMQDILSYDNQIYLFTCIWVILLLYFVLSYPRFVQNDRTALEKDTLVNIRIAFAVGFLAWAGPAFICLASAAKGEFQMIDNISEAEYTPIAVTENQIVTQQFNNTAEEIYDLELYIGNYDRINHSDLEMEIIEADSEKTIFETRIPVNTISENNSWYTLIREPVDVIPGKIYLINIKSNANVNDCIAVYSDGMYNSDRSLEINGEIQTGTLAFKIKGRK
ncbi:hypothetical protein [Wansuia hejianensis]|uniref:Uncharacterized protein n=1 Tax=Wansuia hejianensis TaxID=2763667 RepID=A0A7G9GHE1_9FIRM|nr:hypothetical protein [Wansuia hejianensis]QNM10223.1 hypothetical protein H9Q79_08150 [Wansuia hejianensis]RHV88514.1 hypothetical protein DXA96_11125 [Lachnospiraceae bacterium OF09-33XD]